MLEGIRTALARVFGGGRELKMLPGDIPLSDEIAQLAVAIAVGQTPPRRGAREILENYITLPQLQQVFGKIAQSTSACEWVSYVAKDSSGARQPAKRLQRMRDPVARHRWAKQALSSGALEIIEDDPLIDFIENGNTRMSGLECREVMQLHIELVGECFAWKERDGLGLPIRYWPMAPAWVRDVPRIDDGTGFYELVIKGVVVKVPPSEMIHIKIADPYTIYERGVGLGLSLGDEIDTDEYSAEWLKAFYYNNATPGLLLAMPKIDSKELERFRQDWDNRNRGRSRAHRTHMINTEVTATKLDTELRGIPVVELRKHLRSIIRETPGVPPEVVGLVDNSNRATIDAAMFLYAVNVLVPRLERWRMAWQLQVVPDFDRSNTSGRALRTIGYVSPVPEDRQHQLEVMKAAPWAFSRGEWRESGGHEPHDVADDVYLQNPNLIERPVNDATWEPPPPPPNPFGPAAAPPDGSDPNAPADDGGATDEPKATGGRRRQVAPRRRAPNFLRAADVDGLVDILDPKVLNLQVDEVWRKEMEAWGNRILRETGVEASFNMLNPVVSEYLRKFGADKVVGINDTTRAALREELVAGVDAGEGYREIAARVVDVFEEATGARAIGIARTEAGMAANLATWQGQKQSGVVPRREWISTEDDRTREAHAEANGQTVGIDEPFEVGGEQLMAPGLGDDPENNIMCRCTTGAVIDERGLNRNASAETWKVFDQHLMVWEGRGERAFKAGFRDQHELVAKRLDELRASRGD